MNKIKKKNPKLKIKIYFSLAVNEETAKRDVKTMMAKKKIRRRRTWKNELAVHKLYNESLHSNRVHFGNGKK